MDKSLTYESEDKLVNDLRSGIPAAFEALYRKYYRMVAKQANGMGASDADIEDLFQETLLVLVRNIRDPEFRLTAKLSTYLFAIARNLLLKKTGKKATIAADDDLLVRLDKRSDNNPEDSAHWEAQVEAIGEGLQHLEEDCRQVLHLSFFENRAQNEIASIMGYSESFVKVKKFRCLEYLRKRIKAHPLFRQ